MKTAKKTIPAAKVGDMVIVKVAKGLALLGRIKKIGMVGEIEVADVVYNGSQYFITVGELKFLESTTDCTIWKADDV